MSTFVTGAPRLARQERVKLEHRALLDIKGHPAFLRRA